MASLNLGKDVANKRERKQTAAHKVAKFYSPWQAVGMCRYVSLININPSDRQDRGFFSLLNKNLCFIAHTLATFLRQEYVPSCFCLWTEFNKKLCLKCINVHAKIYLNITYDLWLNNDINNISFSTHIYKIPANIHVLQVTFSVL